MVVFNMINKFKKKILFKKALLNFLLRYLSPSNKIIIYISQDLDKLISRYQKYIYTRYTRKNLRSSPLKKAA